MPPSTEQIREFLWKVSQPLGATELAIPIKEFTPQNFPNAGQMVTLISTAVCLNPEKHMASETILRPDVKELKLVYQAHINTTKTSIGDASRTSPLSRVVDVDTKTILTFDDHSIQRKHYAVLKVYEGEGRPDGTDFYQRICLGRDAEGRAKVRWARVESMKAGVLQAEQIPALDKELGVLSEGYRRFYMQLSIETFQGQANKRGPRGLLHDAQGKDQQLASKPLNAVNALLRLEFGSDAKRVIVLGNKFFSRAPDAMVQGVQFHAGITKTLRIGSPDAPAKVYLSERQCHQLFFPATSLARFMESHFGKSTSLLHDNDIERLTAVLKDVRVSINTSTTGWEKSIRGFSNKTPDQQKIFAAKTGVDMRAADYYAQDGYTLAYPDLPCVNLGSQSRPYYVPPELCSILPDQTFRTSGDNAFQREVAILRSRSLPKVELTHTRYDVNSEDVIYRDDLLQDYPNDINGLSLDRYGVPLIKEPAMYHYTRCRPERMSRITQAKIILVEVGTQPIVSRAWTELQQVMRNLAQRPRLQKIDDDKSDGSRDEGVQVNGVTTETGADAPAKIDNIATVSEEVLKLTYTGDESCLASWTERLAAAVAEQGVKPVDVVVVFAMQDSTKHSAMFMMMKEACNSEKLGVQSVGLSIDAVRQKVMHDRSHGLTRYAHGIYRKMFARTPELGDSKYSRAALAIGIHVTALNRKGTSDPCYLIALVSRELEHSRQYRTTYDIYDPMTMGRERTLDTLFAAHLGKHNFAKETAPQKLVIFRSGAAWSQRGPADEENRAFTETVHKFDWATNDTPVYVISVSQDKGMGMLVRSGNKIADSVTEFQRSRTYYTLRQPKGIFFMQHPGLLGESGKSLFTHLHNAITPDATLTKLEMQPRFTAVWKTLAVPQQSSPGKRPAQLRSPSTSDGFGDESIESSAWRASPGKPSQTQQKKEQAGKPKPAGQLTQKKQQPATLQYVRSKEWYPTDDKAYEELARVFHDGHIGLHECNLPVPSYLARRVTRWAILHAKMATITDNDEKYDTLELQQVHLNRADTLWYL